MSTPRPLTYLSPDAEARLYARLEPYLDIVTVKPLLWGVWCAAQGFLTTTEGLAEYNIGPIVGDGLGDLTEIG
jgi:hypothetical protein